MLDGEDGEDILVEVDSLVVRQEDLVQLELERVAQEADLDVDTVQGVVFQGVPRVRRHRLVRFVDLVHPWMRIVGQILGYNRNDKNDCQLPVNLDCFHSPDPTMTNRPHSLNRLHSRLSCSPPSARWTVCSRVKYFSKALFLNL